ncbi:helix-turn-helix domain-containing protein [Deinococcus kurensis]|uniref:helix-turn-helix domain-containing protein n=1 Tax=Deinococcus kurensis TaxID=2662757 RepID=UPI0012D31899
MARASTRKSVDPAYLQALGQRLRALRKERGWSQDDLAEHADVHRTHPGKLENAEIGNPQIGTLMALATAFGLTLPELLTFPFQTQPEREESPRP